MGVHIYCGIQTHLLRILIHQLEALILASSIRLVNVKTRHCQHLQSSLARFSSSLEAVGLVVLSGLGKNDRLGGVLEEFLQLYTLFFNSSQGMFVGRCRGARCWEWTRRLGHGWVKSRSRSG